MEKFKKWVEESSEIAAIAIREFLQPVGGDDDVIFPPTFADPKGRYAIDETESGNVCIIDTVGSQANRIEPLFKENDLKDLVPQIIIEAGSEKVNLLDAGHRLADAIIRFTDLSEDISTAFQEHDAGNTELLAKLAPTSLIFGAWDSRDTEVKVSRIVSSTIRAYNVNSLKRSATYFPPVDYIKEGLVDENEAKNLDDEKNPAAQIGLSHIPARGLGGIIVRGDIRRDAILNISTLRRYFVREGDKVVEDRTKKLREYLLGLSLCAVFTLQRHDLRQGCLLVRHPNKSMEVNLVSFDGSREKLMVSFEEILNFANEAAIAFGVGESQNVTFDKDSVKGKIKEIKGKNK